MINGWRGGCKPITCRCGRSTLAECAPLPRILAPGRRREPKVPAGTGDRVCDGWSRGGGGPRPRPRTGPLTGGAGGGGDGCLGGITGCVGGGGCLGGAAISGGGTSISAGGFNLFGAVGFDAAKVLCALMISNNRASIFVLYSVTPGLLVPNLACRASASALSAASFSSLVSFLGAFFGGGGLAGGGSGASRCPKIVPIRALRFASRLVSFCNPFSRLSRCLSVSPCPFAFSIASLTACFLWSITRL